MLFYYDLQPTNPKQPFKICPGSNVVNTMLEGMPPLLESNLSKPVLTVMPYRVVELGRIQIRLWKLDHARNNRPDKTSKHEVILQ